MDYFSKAGTLAAITVTLMGGGTATALACPSPPTCEIVAGAAQPTRTNDTLVAAGSLRCDAPADTLSLTVTVTNMTTGAVVSTNTTTDADVATVSARATRPCVSFTGPYFRATFAGYSEADGKRTSYEKITQSSPYCEV